MKKNITLVALVLLTLGVCKAQENEQNRPPKPPTLEQRLNRVSTELNKQLQLAQDQKDKILAAYKAFFADMEKNRDKDAPPPPPPPVKKEIAEKLIVERDAKIKQVLSEEQYKKYVEIEKILRPKRPHREEPPHTKE